MFKKKNKKTKTTSFYVSERDQTTSFWSGLLQTGTFVPAIPGAGRKNGKMKKKKQRKMKKKRKKKRT